MCGAPVGQRCEGQVEGRQEIDAVWFDQSLDAGALSPEGCFRWQNHPQLYMKLPVLEAVMRGLRKVLAA